MTSDVYQKMLNSAYDKQCIANIEDAENIKEVWIDVLGHKFLYKSWKIFDKWTQAVYIIISDNRIELLTDQQVKNLYQEIENLGDVYELN